MKMNSKVIVDPQSLEESSLTNNLVLVTSYVQIGEFFNSRKSDAIGEESNQVATLNPQKIASTVDKGSNFLRCSYEGCQAQGVV